MLGEGPAELFLETGRLFVVEGAASEDEPELHAEAEVGDVWAVDGDGLLDWAVVV